jgi:hypothetical protein
MPTPPRFEDVRDDRLTSDEHILTRVSALLDRAVRRQLWLMFLDDEGRQLPAIMPSYIARRPPVTDRDPFGSFLGVLAEDLEAAQVIVIYERRGSGELKPADVEWLRFIRRACDERGVNVRGPLLLSDEGVRWIARDDL